MIQFSTSLRNALADLVESHIGSSSVTLEIRSGGQPANCAASDTGTLLATISIPANWLNDASGGAKTINGTWTDSAADGTGNAAHFRIKASTTCHFQGSVTAAGGGGDMIVDNVSFAAGQAFSITVFTLTAPGA